MSVEDPTVGAVTDPSRLESLHRLALLDTPAEEAFDRFTRLAATILDVPVSLVTLVDENRQFFKSSVGLPEPWSDTRETPLSHSFCKHAVAARTPLIIEDARSLPLVRDNLAIPEMHVVAYLGIPLIISDGQALGSLCVIDTQPRAWTDQEITIVQDLAAAVLTEIELRLREIDLRESQERFRVAFENTAVGVALTDAQGRFLLVNQTFRALIGYSDEDLHSLDLVSITHPDDRPLIIEQIHDLVAGTISDFVIEKRYLRKSGGLVWVQDSVSVARAPSGEPINLITLTQDITSRRPHAEA